MVLSTCVALFHINILSTWKVACFNNQVSFCLGPWYSNAWCIAYLPGTKSTWPHPKAMVTRSVIGHQVGYWSQGRRSATMNAGFGSWKTWEKCEAKLTLSEIHGEKSKASNNFRVNEMNTDEYCMYLNAVRFATSSFFVFSCNYTVNGCFWFP